MLLSKILHDSHADADFGMTMYFFFFLKVTCFNHKKVKKKKNQHQLFKFHAYKYIV